MSRPPKYVGHTNEIVMKHILDLLRDQRFTGKIVLNVNSGVILKHEVIDADTIKARRELEAGNMVTTASLLDDYSGESA